MKTQIKTTFDFVEKYYPNYTSSDEIAENDDLNKILNGQIDGEAEEIYSTIKETINFIYGESLDDSELESEVLKEIQARKNASDASIFEKAIQGFIESQINSRSLTNNE